MSCVVISVAGLAVAPKLLFSSRELSGCKAKAWLVGPGTAVTPDIQLRDTLLSLIALTGFLLKIAFFGLNLWMQIYHIQPVLSSPLDKPESK
jgi:hypothetical protein